jgi:hypothetical protein
MDEFVVERESLVGNRLISRDRDHAVRVGFAQLAAGYAAWP